MVHNTNDSEVANITMLLKCCAILIVFLELVSCGDLKPGTKTTNTSIKSLIDTMNNPLTNRTRLTDKTGRFLNEYNVVTNDEYILSVFRLTYENTETSLDKFPVILVHGLFQSSDRFLQQSEDQSLAFKLQDYGYDVWLANVRGNKYGRRHTSFGPETDDKAIFFNYSYEEIALNDIAATVDFILYNTKFQKIHYIGYSLGGTSFLVLNSMEPEYNNKFETAYLLAPIGYQNFFPNSDLEVEANRCDEIYEELLNHSNVEIFPYKATNRSITFSADECLGDDAYENICNLLNITETMGIQSEGSKIHESRGGSIKQLVHLAQNVKAKRFSRWDYGEKENQEHYGTNEPPKYNLSAITVATTIIYSPNDEYVSPKDIADMASRMGNATIREVRRKSNADIATDEGNTSTTEVGTEDVTNMATNISGNSTAPIKEDRNYVAEVAIDNLTQSKTRRKETTEDINNNTTEEVGEKLVTDNSTEMGVSTTSEAAVIYADTDKDVYIEIKIEENGTDFKHRDFIDAPDVMDLVYKYIINDMERNYYREAYITRQRKKKLADDRDKEKDTNETKSEDEEVNDKINNMDWFMVAVLPGLILFATLFFICFVLTIDYDCHCQL